jgi:hypothetical protein
LPGENHSTWDDAAAMIYVMFRYAFLLRVACARATSAVADVPKAALPAPRATLAQPRTPLAAPPAATDGTRG